MNKSFNKLFNLNPRYSTSISFILGLLLIDGLTAYEQNVLGNWLILVGQTILTNASCQNLIEGRISGRIFNINSKEVKCLYNPAVYDIDKIKEIIKQVYPNSISDVDTLSDIVNELNEKIKKIK